MVHNMEIPLKKKKKKRKKAAPSQTRRCVLFLRRVLKSAATAQPGFSQAAALHWWWSGISLTHTVKTSDWTPSNPQPPTSWNPSLSSPSPSPSLSLSNCFLCIETVCCSPSLCCSQKDFHSVYSQIRRLLWRSQDVHLESVCVGVEGASTPPGNPQIYLSLLQKIKQTA